MKCKSTRKSNHQKLYLAIFFLNMKKQLAFAITQTTIKLLNLLSCLLDIGNFGYLKLFDVINSLITEQTCEILPESLEHVK